MTSFKGARNSRTGVMYTRKGLTKGLEEVGLDEPGERKAEECLYSDFCKEDFPANETGETGISAGYLEVIDSEQAEIPFLGEKLLFPLSLLIWRLIDLSHEL